MSFAIQNRRPVQHSVAFDTLFNVARCGLLSLLLGTTAALATPCASVSLDAGDTWRSASDPASGPASNLAPSTTCFTVNVHDAGRLALELVSPVAGPATRMSLHCSESLPQARRLSHADRHLLMDVVPGTYRIQVQGVDPEAEMPDFRLRSAFVYAPPTKGEDDHELEIEVDPLMVELCQVDPTKGEDDHELEIEVDPLLFPGFPSPAPTKGEDDHELEIEVDPMITCLPPTKGEDDHELEIEVDPMIACAPPTKGEDDHELEIEVDPMMTGLPGLCDDEPGDAQGDGILCAAPLALGTSTVAEIANRWADDQDAYSFTLDRPTTVRLRLDAWAGALDAALYDAAGQRLQRLVSDDGGRWVRRLQAGTYHLRIDGEHGTTYRFGLDSLDRDSRGR